MAPPAGKRAPFEKNGRPDAGTVMNGISFDVKYQTGLHCFEKFAPCPDFVPSEYYFEITSVRGLKCFGQQPLNY
jgi:hypothetical protein